MKDHGNRDPLMLPLCAALRKTQKLCEMQGNARISVLLATQKLEVLSLVSLAQTHSTNTCPVLHSFPRNKPFLKTKGVLSKGQPYDWTLTSSNCKVLWPVLKPTLAGAEWLKKPVIALPCAGVGCWAGEVGDHWILCSSWPRKCLTSNIRPSSLTLAKDLPAPELRWDCQGFEVLFLLFSVKPLSFSGQEWLLYAGDCLVLQCGYRASSVIPCHALAPAALPARRDAHSHARCDADTGDQGGVICPCSQQGTAFSIALTYEHFPYSLKGWY